MKLGQPTDIRSLKNDVTGTWERRYPKLVTKSDNGGVVGGVCKNDVTTQNEFE